MTSTKDDFRCDDCYEEADTLYQGWFRNEQAYNPWAKGTATAGLIQQRRLCYDCVKRAGRRISND